MMERNAAKLTFRFPAQANDTDKRNQVEEIKKEIEQQVNWSDWQYAEADSNEGQTGQEHVETYIEIAKKDMNTDPGHSDRYAAVTSVNPLYQQQGVDLEDEMTRIERVIREAGGTEPVRIDEKPVEELDETAEAVEEHDRDWKHEMPAFDYSTIKPVKTRPNRPTILRVALSVVGAVATGLALGLLTLSLFKGDTPLPDLTRDVPVMGTIKDEGSDTKGEGASNDAQSQQSSTKANAVAIDIPARTKHVLQYGVFSQAEGAKKAEEELRSLGLAAVRVPGEDQGTERVFAAIADSRNDAMLLSDALKSQELELYVRPQERKAYTSLKFTGDAKLLQQFVGKGDTVQDWLITQSAAMLQASTPAAFDKSSMDTLRNVHQQWTEEGQKLKKTLNSEDEKEWARIVQSMNTAINAVNEYNKKPSSAQLWNIQQASIQYALLEEAWLNRLTGE
ncbi:hypothetical protein [Paenibacillus sp. 1001270B_150601_E10]|uniref:hypothetical protein n=1 Tax=Paenibacillus sp. 1001270B_150601_E10 TaxID=2787079 RepID=UPI00189F6400|nr:hypothetical protein [Paenibacillus sp. 1001270B_150601_E10]